MSDTGQQTGTEEGGGGQYDAPNQQVVRPDGSHPADEGSGGSTHGPNEPGGGPVDLDAMTKDELLAYARERGISPANASMSKDDIRASIDEAGT